MSRAIIVLQEKGGLAKTFLAIHLTIYLRKLGHTFRPVDFDLTEGLLSRVFPPPASGNLSPDVVLLKSGESMLPAAMRKVLEGSNYLFDCGANTGVAWVTLFNETYPSLLSEMEKAGVKMTLVVPVSSDLKSRQFFGRYKEWFPKADIVMVVVRSYSSQLIELPEHPRNLTIELPIAPPKLFWTYSDRAMSIDDIAASTDNDLQFDRGFALGYLPRLHAEFDKIRPALTP